MAAGSVAAASSDRRAVKQLTQHVVHRLAVALAIPGGRRCGIILCRCGRCRLRLLLRVWGNCALPTAETLLDHAAQRLAELASWGVGLVGIAVPAVGAGWVAADSAEPVEQATEPAAIGPEQALAQ